MANKLAVPRTALVAVSCLLFFLLAGRAEAAAPEQSVLYTGEMTFSVEDGSEGLGGWESTEEWNYHWAMSAAGTISAGAHTLWSVSAFTGSWTHSGSDPEGFSCGGTIAQWEYEPEFPEIANPPPVVEETAGGWTVTVQPPAAVERGEGCGAGSATSGKENVIDRWLPGPFKVDFPKEGSYTQPIERSLDCEAGSSPECGANGGEGGPLMTSIEAQLTFSSGGTAPPTQVGPTVPGAPGKTEVKNKDRRKHDAAVDLEKALKDALTPCAVAGFGNLTAATKGGLLTVTLGGRGAADALAEAGQNLYDAWKDQCDAAVKRIEADFKTAEDPPLPSWRALARPRRAGAGKGDSCAGMHGTKAKFCAFEASQEELVVAAKLSASVAGAIEKTIDRESGALDASEAAAAKAQGAQAAKLQGKYEQALKAQEGDEAAFTAALGKAGLRLNLTKGAKKKAGELIAAKLSAAGVSRTGLAKYTGALPG